MTSTISLSHAGPPWQTLARALLALCMLLAAGCSAEPQPQACVRPDVYCAGLVTDFGSVRSGKAHEAWLALQDAQAAHMFDRVDYIETTDVSDRAANIAVLADAGYDVIVTSGYPLARETATAAAHHPDIAFIGIDQPNGTSQPNLVGLVFHEERSGFMAGLLAALMTETGLVSAVCDSKWVDAMRRYCDGFAAGARYGRLGIQVSVDYREGSSLRLFNDPEWGAQMARQRVRDGADVVFAAGGNTAHAALLEAAEGGAYVIGSETDPYGELPAIRPRLLPSAINNIRLGVVDLLRLARYSTLPPGEYEGQVALAPWHDLERQVPQAVKDDLDKVETQLAAGSITVDVPYRVAPPAKEATPKPQASPTP